MKQMGYSDIRKCMQGLQLTYCESEGGPNRRVRFEYKVVSVDPRHVQYLVNGHNRGHWASAEPVELLLEELFTSGRLDAICAAADSQSEISSSDPVRRLEIEVRRPLVEKNDLGIRVNFRHRTIRYTFRMTQRGYIARRNRTVLSGEPDYSEQMSLRDLMRADNKFPFNFAEILATGFDGPVRVNSSRVHVVFDRADQPTAN